MERDRDGGESSEHPPQAQGPLFTPGLSLGPTDFRFSLPPPDSKDSFCGKRGCKARLFPGCFSCFVISLLHSSCPCLEQPLCLEQDLGHALAEEGEPLAPCLGLPFLIFLPISSCFAIWSYPWGLASRGMTDARGTGICAGEGQSVANSGPGGPMDTGRNLKGSG